MCYIKYFLNMWCCCIKKERPFDEKLKYNLLKAISFDKDKVIRIATDYFKTNANKSLYNHIVYSKHHSSDVIYMNNEPLISLMIDNQRYEIVSELNNYRSSWYDLKRKKISTTFIEMMIRDIYLKEGFGWALIKDEYNDDIINMCCSMFVPTS